MKVERIKAGLEKLLPVLEEWEAAKVAKDFQKLVELMDGYEDMTIDSFCKKAREGLEGKKAVAGSGGAALRQQVVDAHVETLKTNSGDEALFNTAIQEISADKQVRIKELRVIAADFMGLTPLSKKKPDLLAEMKTKRAQDIRTEHKFNILSKW